MTTRKCGLSVWPGQNKNGVWWGHSSVCYTCQTDCSTPCFFSLTANFRKQPYQFIDSFLSLSYTEAQLWVIPSFRLHGGSAPLTPTLVKGQVNIVIYLTSPLFNHPQCFLFSHLFICNEYSCPYVIPHMCKHICRINSQMRCCWIKRYGYLGFPGGAVVKNPPAKAGDMGSSPGPGRSHMPWSN